MILKRSVFLILPILLLLVFTVSCDETSSNNSLESAREECDGVPECVSFETEFMDIPGDGLHVFNYTCPEENPYIHNIDVARNDNVNFVVMDWSETSVTVKYFAQDPESEGLYQAFLGCSTMKFDESDGVERFSGSATKPESIPDEPSDIPTDENFSTPTACNESIPDCVNVTTKRHAIGHLKTHKINVHCPKGHFFVRYSDHRSSGSVSIVEDPASKNFFARKGMSFFVTNWSATHDHHWQIAIACSSACQYADGGCPCGKGHYGCHNDPLCPVTQPRKSECGFGHVSCWDVWAETCKDGQQWECNTTLGWPCCQSCQ